MPYFDDKTYAISRYIGDDEKLFECAREFCDKYMDPLICPKELVFATTQGLYRENRNEIIIMADGTTEYGIHMEKAFDAGLLKSRTRESRFELLCVTFAALFSKHIYEHNGALYQKVFDERRRYEEMYDSDDLKFLDDYMERRVEEYKVDRERRNEELNKLREAWKEEQQKEEILREQRRQKRAEAAEKKRAEQKAIQAKRNAERQKELEEFQKKTLEEQLETILSNRKIPEAYGVDFCNISDADLRSIPRAILVRVITSFMNVKGVGWKDLQKKAKEILSE